MNPHITVLMALYNGGEYLKQAVQSVLSQTYGNFEFLIINDCSTDDSLEIIESFHDQRIKVYHNAGNLGQTPSLNIGLKLARGDYFTRIDGDDVALPQWLKIQVKAAERYPDYSVISSYAVAIDEQNRVKKVYSPPLDSQDIILRSLIAPPIHHVGSIFKTKDIVEIGGYDDRYIYAADYELWERLIRKGYKITTTPKVLVAIREHAQSVSRSDHGRRDLEEVKVLAKKNISRFVQARFSDDEISLFCRANYDEGNLTDMEFNQAFEITKRVYANLRPSLDFAGWKIRQWARKRCTTIYIKRIFSFIKRKDCRVARGLSCRGVKEFGFFSVFTILWAASFLGGAGLTFLPRIYNQYLRKKACLQLSAQPNKSFH